MDLTPEQIKFYEDRIEAYASTKGRKKMWNYFLDIAKTDYFIEKIKTLRRECGLPENGLERDESMQIPPEGFRGYRKEINQTIEEICKKYSLHSLDWEDPIEIYLYYNKLENPVWNYNASDVCYLADLAAEKKDPFEKSTQADDDTAFPIAIRISPYASQRDIIDFVKRTYRYGIKPYQEGYKKKDVKIGMIRSKKEKIQKRNEFIYQNQHLPRKKIMQLVTDKFGNAPDYGHIGKIISLENKKRKEV